MSDDSYRPTPLATKVILVIVLAITALAHCVILLDWIQPEIVADVAAILWLFTFLFVLRVAGQIVVAVQPQKWLPPMRQWNFIPYPILLPIQLVFIAVMTWINVAFSQSAGISTVKNQQAGTYLLAFSALYVIAMVIRYILNMSRHPERRWFGGTIPIVFHLVLASYFYALGRFFVNS